MSLSTRSEALTQARVEFSALVTRVRASNVAPAAYVDELAEHWTSTLMSLSRIGAEIPVSRQVAAALEFLTSSIKDESDPSVDLRWLDAFPDTVAGLFPPSAITYSLAPDDRPAQVAKGSRSQIAFAA